MPSIPFCKFHGFGNEYIVIERGNIAAGISLPDLAKAICDRSTGVGSDGIAVLEKLAANDADFFCEIINPDGGVAGFSGNGTRCAAAYLYYKGIWSDVTLSLKTRSGVKRFRLLGRDGDSFEFEAEIGAPRFDSENIPIATVKRETVVDEPVSLAGGQYTFSAVNVGNPVACIFVDAFTDEWRTVGRAMESHEMFPERTNVVFVRILDRENIEVRIWERGAGETAASGTCASAAAVMSANQNKTGHEVNVHSPGGTTHVVWREDGEVALTGRADLAYCGEWPLTSDPITSVDSFK
jgi:diaminopimelate epimerase